MNIGLKMEKGVGPIVSLSGGLNKKWTRSVTWFLGPKGGQFVGLT